jgi:hypothetical protein
LSRSIDRIQSAREKYGGRADLSQQIEAREVSLAAAQDCVTRTAESEKQPGADAEIRLRVALGDLTLAQLRDLCRDETAAQTTLLPRLRWRNRVNGVLVAMEERIRKFAVARAAEEKLNMLSDYRNSLAQDLQALRAEQHHPDADADFLFESRRGRSTLAAIADAASNELNSLDKVEIDLRWSVEASALAKRVAETDRQRLKGMADPDPAAKDLALASAFGGYQECVERSAWLLKQPGVQRSLDLQVGDNRFHIVGLQKYCAGQHKDLDKLLTRR